MLRRQGHEEFIDVQRRKGIADAVMGNRARKVRLDAPRALPRINTHRERLEFEAAMLPGNRKPHVGCGVVLQPDLPADDVRGEGSLRPAKSINQRCPMYSIAPT